MRLISFRIRNFKSIIDTGECHLSENDNILVLAGQNEAGKSAVLEALDFFGNGPSEHFERLHRRKEEHPEVVCKCLLDGSDIEAVFNTTQNEALKKYLQKNKVLSFVRGDINKDNFDDVFFTDETVELLGRFFQQEETINSTETAGEGQNLPNVKNLAELEQFLFERIGEFVLFDTFTDLLPGVVAISDMPKYPAISDFEKVFKVNFAEVVKKEPRAIERAELRLQKQATDNLNTYWTQRLEEGGKYNFIINIVPKIPVESASQIEFMIDRDDGNPLFVEQKSKGFRWFSAFNLRLRALGVEEDTIKNLIILIDEPGQGLHEKAQRDVKQVMEELAEKGAQIIYATHYPNLIGTEGKEFARIRIVSNAKEVGTKVETVAQYAARAGQGAQDSVAPLVTAMGIHSVGALLDLRRLNVVVEGISDHYYFTAFKKLLNKDERLYFLPACGVNNVPNLVSVLIGWGFNYKAVFDDDPKSGRIAYNLLKKEFYENDDNLAHGHILKIKDCNGIEDILGPKDFHKFSLNEPMPKGGPKERNSKLAAGRKELLARLFLERAEKGEVVLSKESTKRIEEAFRWLYEKFNITPKATG